jgi:hypothetical protein
MIYILLLLSMVSLCGLFLTCLSGGAAGMYPALNAAHFLLALGTAVGTIFAHCLVLLYFLGTGKSLEEAVEQYKLSPELLTWAQESKRRVFPLLAGSALVTVVAAIMGGGADTGRVPPFLHGLVGVAALVLNVWAFHRELTVVGRNSEILEGVKKQIAGQDVFDLLEEPATPQSREVLGRNLIFLGLNIWIPYIYMRYIMRMEGTPFIPFVILSVGGSVAGVWILFTKVRRKN